MTASEHDAPAAPAGWQRHPEHPTVERFWDGARFTGEHRFAAVDPEAPAAGESHAPVGPAAEIPWPAVGWLAGAALAAFLVGLAAIASGHGVLALLVAPSGALFVGALYSRPLHLSIAALFGAGYGFLHGAVVAAIDAHLHPCGGWFCLDPSQTAALAGFGVAVLGLASVLVGRGVAWLAAR